MSSFIAEPEPEEEVEGVVAVPEIDFRWIPEEVRTLVLKYMHPKSGESFSQSFPESAKQLAALFPAAVIVRSSGGDGYRLENDIE